MRFIWPLDDHYITRGFDFKSSIYIGGQHAAVDLVRLQGDTIGRLIKASASGIVVGDDFNSTSGYYIVIGHEGGWRTTYRHLVTDAPPVIGDQVSQGQIIGNVGSTGWSTGPHLHFDLWHIDKQDPTAFSKVGWWAHNPELYLGQEEDMTQGEFNQMFREAVKSVPVESRDETGRPTSGTHPLASWLEGLRTHQLDKSQHNGGASYTDDDARQAVKERL